MSTKFLLTLFLNLPNIIMRCTVSAAPKTLRIFRQTQQICKSGTSLVVDDFHSYEFRRVWGGTHEESVKKVWNFFQSNHVHQLEVKSGAKEALLKLKEIFSLHIVTARPNYAQEITKNWIDKHFHGLFDGIHFGNQYGTDGSPKSKASICKDIGAKLLIDDSLQYALTCMSEGIPTVLFGKYPWNCSDDYDIDRQDVNCYDWMIRRVLGWSEVVDLVYSRILGRSFVSSTNPTQNGIPSSPSYIAAIQLTSTNDVSYNLERIRHWCKQAVAKGATLVCFPECCLFMGINRQDIFQVAQPLCSNETMTNQLIRHLCDIAKESNCFVSVGGFPEKFSDDKVHNTHIIIDNRGEVIEPVYRKMHLFDNPLTNLYESNTTVAGDKKAVVNTNFARLGLSICYDLRFPELYRSLCSPDEANGGADIVLVPSAFTVPTGQAHWEVLLRARAIENQVYVVAAAQSGRHNENRVSYGHTMIIDPWGRVVSECLEEGEGMCIAEFSTELIKEIRSKNPVWVSRVRISTDAYWSHGILCRLIEEPIATSFLL